ncbi:hypothetical protein PRIPAC_88505 [Pristionchus pacificus]|uniref:Ribosomal protein n=1 Tax=Pristionchus pacificus TaxID=54126 RepID=A0A2A6CWN4_PRIPA|nr:hypothetical protein PRIPAC_88505 [Pristionchus pacificus]|eukprot:PDM82500.1 ribosomal protein [Pristionchus pacificus]
MARLPRSLSLLFLLLCAPLCAPLSPTAKLFDPERCALDVACVATDCSEDPISFKLFTTDFDQLLYCNIIVMIKGSFGKINLETFIEPKDKEEKNVIINYESVKFNAKLIEVIIDANIEDMSLSRELTCAPDVFSDLQISEEYEVEPPNKADEWAIDGVNEAVDVAHAFELESDLPEVKLFGKWNLQEVNFADISLVDYIAVKENAHFVGHYQVKHLACSLMMRGRNDGKKLMTVRIVKHSFEIIHLHTEENPVQMLVNVVINSGPREDSTRIERAGTVRRRASLNQVMWPLCAGAREAVFRNIKTIAECLADELINAAKGSSNSYAIKKKDGIEFT